MISAETPIGKIIQDETAGSGCGYYTPGTQSLTVYYPNAEREKKISLLRKLQTHIDRNGLWRSFEQIKIYS